MWILTKNFAFNVFGFLILSHSFVNIPDVSGLPTKSALTVVENEIPDINSLVRKQSYHTKISELE